LLGKPVLDDKIFSLNPTKLAQLLPERLHEARATGSSAWIQETDAEDFPCLLRVGGEAKSKEKKAGNKADDFFLHVFYYCLFRPKADPPVIVAEPNAWCLFSLYHLVRPVDGKNTTLSKNQKLLI
jgi:hypothetical protein